MCTKFGVDSSSRLPVRARTNRQIDKQTRLNALPTPTAMPSWVTTNERCLTFFAPSSSFAVRDVPAIIQSVSLVELCDAIVTQASCALQPRYSEDLTKYGNGIARVDQNQNLFVYVDYTKMDAVRGVPS